MANSVATKNPRPKKTKKELTQYEIEARCRKLIRRRLNFYGLIQHGDFCQSVPYPMKDFRRVLEKMSDSGEIRISRIRYKTPKKIVQTLIYFIPTQELEELARKIQKNYVEYLLYRAKKEEENPWQRYQKEQEKAKIEYDKSLQSDEEGYFEKTSSEFIPSPMRIKRLSTQFAILRILFPSYYTDNIHQRSYYESLPL